MPKIDKTLHHNPNHKEPQHLSFSETVANEKDPEIIIPALAIASHLVWRIRSFLAYQVNLGTAQILWLQKIRNPYLDVYLEFASICGSEIFYFFLMPFLYIVFDPTLARLLNLLFGFSVLTGNFLKNIFCLPRPPSPPVWKPKKSDAQLDCRDFGFPSTHSINAVSLPFMILRYFYGFAWVWESDSPIFLSCLYLSAFGWAGSIIFSRMYLGVHSPTDTTGGMVIGSIILRVFLLYSDQLDLWTLTSRYVPHTMLLFSGIMMLIHPQTRPASYSYAETTALLGWLTGSICGSSLSSGYYVPLLEGLSYQPHSNYLVICLLALARYIFGMVLMQVAQTAAKTVMIKSLTALNWWPSAKERTPHSDLTICETMVKYFSYVVMGFVIGSGLPLIIDAQFRAIVGL